MKYFTHLDEAGGFYYEVRGSESAPSVGHCVLTSLRSPIALG